MINSLCSQIGKHPSGSRIKGLLRKDAGRRWSFWKCLSWLWKPSSLTRRLCLKLALTELQWVQVIPLAKQQNYVLVPSHVA